MIISREIQILHFQANTEQLELFQVQASMFQTVYSVPVHQQITAVLFIALQLLIYLLNHPLSSPVRQAINLEEPFTLKMAMANVFCMNYVVMIVTQHIQVVNRLVSFLE
jgi:hypothetical protein